MSSNDFLKVGFKLDEEVVTQSKIGQRKGKLNIEAGDPYFLENIDYFTFYLMAIYLVYFILTLVDYFGVKVPVKLKNRIRIIRISNFEGFLVDYLVIGLRDIGNYPTDVMKGRSISIISYILSMAIIWFFTYEFMVMMHDIGYRLIHKQHNSLNDQ